jgi:hypothetical protein
LARFNQTEEGFTAFAKGLEKDLPAPDALADRLRTYFEEHLGVQQDASPKPAPSPAPQQPPAERRRPRRGR